MNDSHYTFLGLDPAATETAIMTAVEDLSKRANAVANVDPERSQYIRSRLRQIRADLLSSPERRRAYNAYLQSVQPAGSAQDVPLTANWTTSAQQTPPQPPPRSAPPPGYAYEAGGGMAPPPPPSRRNMYWIAAVLALLLLLFLAAGSALALHIGPFAQPTATPLPTSTPTPVPPTPTVPPPTAEPTTPPDPTQAIKGALQRSNDAYVASMNCACDAGLEKVKINPDLQKYLDEISQMQAQGVHHNITTSSYTIDSVHLESSIAASAIVTKDETDQTIASDGSVTSTCQGPYQVQYHLQRVGGVWKVDNSSVLPGGSRSCS